MNQEPRRISTPTIKINELDKSLHQFRSLRLENRNIIRSSSIILETSESVPEIQARNGNFVRPISCGSIKSNDDNSKTLSRSNSRYKSKSIKAHDKNLKRNDLSIVHDITSDPKISSLNRSISSSQSNAIVREQYWKCCSKKWTRRERILIITVTTLVIIVLGLIIVIGILAAKERNVNFL